MLSNIHKDLFLKTFLDDKQLLSVMDALGGDGSQVRVIGGAVRNVLRHVPVSDVDLATIHEPNEIVLRVEAAGFRAVPTGIEHGTITVVGDQFTVEVTTLREDIETNGRHAKVRFGSDWHADAQRRDFTMNALAVDQAGTLYDLVDGVDDCLVGKVHFIGDAFSRIHEDALRILRFLRFSAHYGDGPLEAEGYSAIEATRGLLAHLSVERVQQEFKKLLIAPNARQLALVLNQAAEADVLPGFSLNADISAIGLGDRPDSLLRLLLLLESQPGKAKEVVQTLRFSKKEQLRISQLDDVLAKLKLVPEPNSDALFELAYLYGKQNVEDGLYCLACLGTDTGLALQRLRIWNVPIFPVSGSDLIAAGIEAGPKLGDILSAMEKEWVSSRFSMSKEVLLQSLKNRK